MKTSTETSLKKTIQSGSRTAADYLHRGIDRTAYALHETTETAANSAAHLADSADRGADMLRTRQRQLRATLLNYSRHHPLRALAIGLGTGFVLAKLTQRSH